MTATWEMTAAICGPQDLTHECGNPLIALEMPVANRYAMENNNKGGGCKPWQFSFSVS
jgi:hypothetical protein